MSKNLHIADGLEAEISHSFLRLDDDILEPVWSLVSANRRPQAWALFQDLYGDAAFDPESACLLAEECTELGSAAEPAIRVWLLTIAGFVRSVGKRRKYVIASAD